MPASRGRNVDVVHVQIIINIADCEGRELAPFGSSPVHPVPGRVRLRRGSLQCGRSSGSSWFLPEATIDSSSFSFDRQIPACLARRPALATFFSRLARKLLCVSLLALLTTRFAYQAALVFLAVDNPSLCVGKNNKYHVPPPMTQLLRSPRVSQKPPFTLHKKSSAGHPQKSCSCHALLTTM